MALLFTTAADHERHSKMRLAITAIALGLVSLHASASLFRTLRINKLRAKSVSVGGGGDVAASQHYSDRDGVATDETMRSYSTRWQTLLTALCAGVGACVSLAQAVLVTLEAGDVVIAWLTCAIWLPLIFQSIDISIEKEPVRKYNIALSNSLTYLLGFAVFCYVDDLRDTSSPVKLGLVITRACVALAGFLICTLYPRRPDVTYDGRLVDGQRTASAFSRYTYTWLSPLLAFASKKGVLHQDDLPKLDATTRSRDLHDDFVARISSSSSSSSPAVPLWRKLIRAHSHGLAMQYGLTTLDSVLIVAPQAAMFRLLKLLEERANGADVTVEASLWVLGLGAGIVVQNFFENWRWWVSYGYLNVPIRVQLSALIFAKSMRRKDVKGGQKKDEGDSEGDEEDEEEKDGEDAMKLTQQATVNLVGVDTKRVADYVTYQNGFWGAFIKIIVSFVFIYKLVGWQALVAGIIAQLATIPLNMYFAKRYASAQNDLMVARDRKLNVLNEALMGIRQIKFSALEKQWQKKIADYREVELSAIWRVFIADTFLIFCWIFGPYMLSAVTLAVHALINDHLYPSVAFTTIGILTQIEGTMAFIPELIAVGVDAWVSIKRIDEYLNAPEKPQNTWPGDHVSFKNASVAWPSDSEKNEESFVLRNLNFTFPNRQLSVISGRTGSGKTLLLKAILGEVDVISGTIEVPRAPPADQRFDHKANRKNWIIDSAIAFVSQQPWIENCSFRDNVLFGLPFDAVRYRKVLSACALDKDLTMLTDGDSTEIGAQGINLSGGQRWRITLARALYSRAGILVMDDIFSAVDAHVGRHIFENALTGELAVGRTRIIVTHHVSLTLPKTKFEVFLSGGRVERAGTVDSLRRTGELQDILEEERNEEAIVDGEAHLDLPNGNGHAARRRSSAFHRRPSAASMGESGGDALVRYLSRTSERSDFIDDGGHVEYDNKEPAKKFVEEETKMKGKVLWSVYMQYVKAGGGYWFWAGIVLAFCAIQALILGRSWWLTIWTSQYKTQSEPAKTFVASVLQHPMIHNVRTPYHAQTLTRSTKFYVGIYVLISCTISLCGAARYFWVYCGSIRASRKLFDDLTYAVLRAPLRWLDTVPTGRVLNRFTADFSTLDLEQANAFSFMLFNLLMVIGIVIAGMMVTPVMILFAIILLALCVRYALYYLVGARETKRLESLAKSPVFELFGAALSGLGTIRAFGKTDDYINAMFAKIDMHGQTMMYMWAFNRWLTFRLGVVGAAFAVAMAALIVSLNIDAALAGFAIGFTLEYSIAVVWMLRQYAIVELSMNAVERILEYSEIAIEDQEGADAPAHWPAEGRLEVDDLVVSYASDLEPVLKGVSFAVAPNERVGVVGRTGAGKSSLTLALFRFLEARRGSITIDGVDIANVKLEDLRSRLAIIPQDPVLFSGTVRSNIDPFAEHDDRELREALERVHLVSSAEESSSDDNEGEDGVNKNPFSSLSTTISEGGSNLSQGQRQLLCLARAIVARPKVMILDEATSAVDKATDALIQRSVREEFSDSTLIVIAHRLSTIADFDRILVLGEGKVVEFGSPRELLEKEDGAFHGMVEDSGEREVLREIILGEARE
ncbi:ATP-dependent bile acid permease [Lasiodiplodia theobromae]|uniref:ATP-dependent bile acid permease n=1 Tax=Lasiodiplodia theobromae TaxID=45133 RepID=A0A5N5D2J2_9PEZI|nr:ATP-dependent bile acid permease [Lasiodiplodia theobromae]KAB2571771.1 ATP-dependent bile acid permease [Lasiodiplodia theobromae]KAF4541820.1 ATP-dependent bile acid permease [Lasiodiplodia theobromae]